MDNRWRFLYCAWPELRGRMRRARAGSEETGASGEAGREEKPPPGGRAATRTERRVGKRADRVPRKAAIALCAPVPQSDTGGQGEDPKAGGRSIAKELGKMAP